MIATPPKPIKQTPLEREQITNIQLTRRNRILERAMRKLVHDSLVKSKSNTDLVDDVIEDYIQQAESEVQDGKK